MRAARDTEAMISISHQLPTLVRQDDRVTVKGSLTGATPGARAALELKRTAPGGKWTVVAHARLNRHGAFTLRWRVTKRELPGPVSLRVAGLRRSGAVLVSTLPVQSAIGPAAVYCAPATPPMVAIPVGSGWIVGGRIIQGGPFPGVYECDSEQYTVTATNAAGLPAATQTVAGGHSYTLVVPAGTYTLKSDFCSGTATVTAGEQTAANTYCDVP